MVSSSLTSGASTVATNAIDGKKGDDLLDGVLTSVIAGGVAAGVAGGCAGGKIVEGAKQTII